MGPELRDGYRAALLDWLACAVGGVGEPAARAARAAGDGMLDRVTAAGTAGHVLDFDDTYLPGIAHLSAAVAPAALVLGAECGASVGDVLDAYSAGFEAMAAFSRASHPALYDGGWHPTAVCGPLGAAVAASSLLGLDLDAERSAAALALLRSGGMRAAFGGAGKSIGVGMAAAAGVSAARMAAAGAVMDLDRLAHGADGFGEVFKATFSHPGEEGEAIRENWIKAYPCCLQTHGAIETALALRGNGAPPAGPIAVVVHPLSLQAAPVTVPRDGLEAKFSIPYLAAFALLHGAPAVADFEAVDAAASQLGSRITIRPDPTLAESAAVLEVDGREAARVEAALGSPQNPLGELALAEKRRSLAGPVLDGALEDPRRPAADLLATAGLL